MSSLNRRPLRTLSLVALPLFATAAAAQPRLEVDLSERTLYVYSGSKLERTYPVAVGTRKHPTPTGRYRIGSIIWNPGWIPPESEWARDEIPRKPGDPANPMRGAKLVFRAPYYYIHGTNAPSSLGSRASHGCIRMSEPAVKDLAEWVQKAAGADRGAAWFRQVRSSNTDTRHVGLPRSVPITIRD